MIHFIIECLLIPWNRFALRIALTAALLARDTAAKAYYSAEAQ